jgi:hypothetical protein
VRPVGAEFALAQSRMIGRYKKAVLKLVQLLRQAERHPGNCLLLHDLQSRLIKLICHADRRLIALRGKRAMLVRQKVAGHLSKNEAVALKAKIRRVENSVLDIQRIQYFWRSFGDAIAFIYCDKHALKHMFFNAHNYEVKPPAGALIQKAGLALEWRIVKESLRCGVPSVLCDITNVLRHGDVCLLAGPDPMPLEVKSSANTNARTSRQIESLTAIQQFLQLDEAAKFHGVSYVRRAAVDLGRNYSNAMNRCIRLSRGKGYAVVNPEKSLTYACVRLGATTESVVRKMRIGPDCLVTLLNDAKSEIAWRYYYPFTLSIRMPEDLYEFLRGDYLLIVIVRIELLIQHCASVGLRLEHIDEPDWIFSASDARPPISDKAPRCAISRALFMRTVFDLDSAEDLCSAQLAVLSALSSHSETTLQRDALKYPPGPAEVATYPKFSRNYKANT